jgi:hypothetical protein
VKVARIIVSQLAESVVHRIPIREEQA